MTADDRIDKLQAEVDGLKKNLGFTVGAADLTNRSIRELSQRVADNQKLIHVLVELTDALTRRADA